jgi:hypothetical protein
MSAVETPEVTLPTLEDLGFYVSLGLQLAMASGGCRIYKKFVATPPKKMVEK